MIPYGRQSLDQADIDAVLDVLKSDYLTQGPQVPKFEAAISDYCKSKYAVASNSATSSLHLACMALGLKPGDRLWTSPITFVASANCARYCGADVDFVDIDPRTYNLCPEALEVKLEKAEQTGTLPKVLVVVHLCGQSCDMKAIAKLARHYGIRIIEDASHALGGHYNDEPIGNCAYSDITVFSFHPVKIITAAEGGIATTNNSELAQKMQLCRSHGITRDAEALQNPSDGPWYYEQVTLGYNYRMSDLHAALGNAQLLKLDDFITQRQAIADRYDTAFSDLPITRPEVLEGCKSAFHLYVVRLPERQRLLIYENLKESGITTNVHYIPVHLQPYYRAMGFKKGDFPQAESYYSEALTLPIFPALSPDQQQGIIETLSRSLL
ncbi:UDP-4-amino-4,6-dideoxy-N-acetyl-beta-L-altrosamine transaminase [Pontibacterium sp.]|uniref:UDP-4-amino-4, 6-dideoxy-N-acetyl-beta-L-altrosamine transaminase n=1 Tax=Pontibacterium sp. TaxID=2036026 RepID=UPI003510FB68